MCYVELEGLQSYIMFSGQCLTLKVENISITSGISFGKKVYVYEFAMLAGSTEKELPSTPLVGSCHEAHQPPGTARFPLKRGFQKSLAMEFPLHSNFHLVALSLCVGGKSGILSVFHPGSSKHIFFLQFFILL